jgi:hypothetical protein
MRTLQELSVIAKLTTVKAVNTAKLQVQKIVRLLIKPPKKPPLSWESIIGEGFPQKTNTYAARNAVSPALSKVNQRLAQLPQEVFDELFRRIQNNAIDEIQAIRLYEKLLDCKVKIVRGHVHFYLCTTNKGEETIDYSTLISRLLQLFVEHTEVIAHSSS